MKKLLIAVLPLMLLAASCSDNSRLSDAYGNFEAVETVVSAEASGKLLEFEVEEGQNINAGDVVGYIDTVQLNLKKLQLTAQKKTIGTKYKNISTQIAVLEEQKKNNIRERDRIKRLLEDDAATGKQLDDINGSIDVLDRQISSVRTQYGTATEEIKTIDVQIQQIDEQIQKSSVVNPVNGTVTMKLAEPFEVVSFGKPLYKIADLTVMDLRVYVSGDQLPDIIQGQKVKVLIDSGKEGYESFEGGVIWISPKAEFTPKIIQTKEERVNLVYAVKVRVKNNGRLKIGMPGEVMFKTEDDGSNNR